MADEMHLLRQIIENPASRLHKLEFKRLSRPEQVLLSIWELEAEVSNGGFAQYFESPAADNARHVTYGLDAIGALRLHKLVEQAIELVGDDVLDENEEERTDRLEGLSEKKRSKLEKLEQQFLASPEDINALLYEYVQKHKASIPGA
ncbi:MAG: DMP19 family protein [Planctomycetia bacterium]